MSLNRSIRVTFVARLCHTDTGIARVISIDDRRLSWQPRASAPVDISRREDAAIDAGENEGVLGSLGAAGRCASSQIDVEVDSGWEVRGAGVDDGGGEVCGEVGVDALVGLERRVPAYLVTGDAADGDGGDAVVDGFDGGADGAGELGDDVAEVGWSSSLGLGSSELQHRSESAFWGNGYDSLTANIWTSDGKFGSAT